MIYRRSPSDMLICFCYTVIKLLVDGVHIGNAGLSFALFVSEWIIKKRKQKKLSPLLFVLLEKWVTQTHICFWTGLQTSFFCLFVCFQISFLKWVSFVNSPKWTLDVLPKGCSLVRTSSLILGCSLLTFQPISDIPLSNSLIPTLIMQAFYTR